MSENAVDVNSIDASRRSQPKSGLLGRRPNEGSGRNWIYRLVIGVILAVPTVLIFTLELSENKGFAAIGLMVALLFLRAPIVIAMSVPGMLGIFAIFGMRPIATILSSEPINTVSSWSLSVLPMFVLMGLLLARSGLTGSMYAAARNWFGWMPGGLAVGTNLAGSGLSAVSGSTIGTTYALTRVGVPEMFRAGYKKPIVIGSVIVAGLPGQLIPPSIFLVIVAGIMQNPVGPQLMAGIVPGLIITGLTGVMIIVFALIKPRWAGRGGENSQVDSISWRDRWVSLGKIWPLLALMLVVIGGLFGGLFTATEAGAAGALGALIFTTWYKRKEHPFRQIMAGMVETVSAVGSILLLLIGAHVLTALILTSGVGRIFSNFIANSGLSRIEFLLVVMVIYIILGMFMDPLAILLTTIPLMLPVLPGLAIDPLWFGVFAVFMGELAILTPPMGILSFVIHRILQDPEVNQGNKVSLMDVFKAVFLFLPIAIVAAISWIFFPELVTWLPSLMAS